MGQKFERFIVFRGFDYEGESVEGSDATLEDAIARAKDYDLGWAWILDCDTRTVVYGSPDDK